MGMGRALLMRDLKEEEKAFQKKAKKKSLWGSIGRTLGGLGAMALTGGAVNPLTVGLISGGASFLGGAAGAKLSNTGDLSKGRFFKADRESAQKELSAFGTQNLMSSLTSGLTAGVGQKLELMKSGKEAAKLSEGFGVDFKGSFVGKGLEKRAIGKELMKAGEASIGTADKTLQVGEGQFITGDRAGMVLPDGTSIGSGRTSLPRGQMPEGGIDKLKSAVRADYTSNLPVGEGAISVEDNMSFGYPGEPFDRSSMLKRQASARYQGTRGISTGVSGSGTDFTRTSAWEGVGQSFPVSAPDSTYGSGTFGLSSTARGYDWKDVSARKAKELSGLRSSIGRR